LLQITIPGTGTLCWPTPARLWDMMPWRKAIVEARGEVPPRFLMSVGDSVESFLYGMGRIFLAIVVLTLAWASGSLMVAIGVDRLFASVIVSGAIPYQLLPTITFIIAWLMAIATGTSWGVMAILFPLLLVPTYTASGGNAELFYATTSAILGGAVAGDHMSPISDTTVLSALACDVTLMQHVITQAPYAMWVVIISLLLGYIPIGYDAYPSYVGIILGCGATALFVFVICVPIISPTGRWDPITKLCCGRRELLQTLSEDCIKKANGETLLLGAVTGCHHNSKEDDTDGNNNNEEFSKGISEYLRTSKSLEGVELMQKNNERKGVPRSSSSPTTGGRSWNPITKLLGGRRRESSSPPIISDADCSKKSNGDNPSSSNESHSNHEDD